MAQFVFYNQFLKIDIKNYKYDNTNKSEGS